MSFVWKLASPTERGSSVHPLAVDPALARTIAELESVSSDWQDELPELKGARVTLRELRAGDAMPLFTAVTNPEVTRFISPPPANVDSFGHFIEWTHRQREAGHGASFAIVPRGSDAAIGLFQLRTLQPDFGNAEWGFLMASEFWGSGLFVASARLVMDFAFDVVGIHRLEARAALRNARGNAALKKLGAAREGVLRKSFLRHGELLDQALWTIVADEWSAARQPRESQVIH